MKSFLKKFWEKFFRKSFQDFFFNFPQKLFPFFFRKKTRTVWKEICFLQNFYLDHRKKVKEKKSLTGCFVAAVHEGVWEEREDLCVMMIRDITGAWFCFLRRTPTGLVRNPQKIGSGVMEEGEVKWRKNLPGFRAPCASNKLYGCMRS